MKETILAIASLFILAACPAQTWIQVSHDRPAVYPRDVHFEDAPPSRPYEVVGIITPPSGEYETEAEAVIAMKKQAAKHGADAIYLESASEAGGWQIGSGWGGISSGSFSELRFRTKAIVWK